MKFFLLAAAFALAAPKEEIAAYKKKEGIIGIAVALIGPKGEKEVICLGDTGHHTGITVKPDTLFRIGRATEIFTEQLVRDYLPLDEPPPLPRIAKLPAPVTVRELLAHTSGYAGLLPASYNHNTASPATLLQTLARSHPHKKEPVFDDTDYALLAIALAEKTKQRVPTLYTVGKFALTLAEQQRRAQGHTGQKLVVLQGLPPHSPFAAARGLYASVSDLANWLQSGNKECTGPFSTRMLSPKLMLTTYTLADRYLGYSVYVAFVPVTGAAVAILANSDCGVERLGQTLLEEITSGN